MTRELTLGWIGSIVFHAGLVTMLLYIRLSQPSSQQQEFVEFSFGGGIASSLGPMPKGEVVPEGSTPPPSGREGVIATGAGVNLPIRQNVGLPDETVNMPATKKIEANENPVTTFGGTKSVANAQREPAPNTTKLGFPGGKDNAPGKPGMATGSDIAAPFNAGGVGNSIASNVSYDIQWSGGGQRNLASGDLPKYPSGVKVGAQIKLRVVVLPSGAVKSAQPLQKGDTRLENAAIKEVRLWMFEPLSSSDPQIEQRCVVTFNFRLK